MISRVIGIILICSINLFSTEMDYIYNKLKECQNYTEDGTMQQGIFDWIVSVDNIEQCDMKQIKFISSDRNRLTVKSNLSLLKSNYEFCDGVKSLDKAFKVRESRLLNMKRDCKNYSKNNFKQKLRKHHGEIIKIQSKVDELMDDMDGGNEK